jgi:dihydrofolate reductase
MRKVVMYELLSLDGVAEEPGNWMFDVDRAIFENLGRVIQKQSDILLGRKTYDYWVDYWPTSDVEPFAGFINGTQKHVFSSKVPPSEWAKSTVVRNSALPYVTGLKQQPGGDIGIHGSIDLARSLLRAGLVDELRLVVAPTVAGGGRRLFDDDGVLQKVTLLDVDRTPSGALLLGYRVGPGDS